MSDQEREKGRGRARRHERDNGAPRRPGDDRPGPSRSSPPSSPEQGACGGKDHDEPTDKMSRGDSCRPSTSRSQLQSGRAFSNASGAGRGQGFREREYKTPLDTKPKFGGFVAQGKEGEVMRRVTSNYFRVEVGRRWHLFSYHVTFVPELENPAAARGLLRDHAAAFGRYIFDGTRLFTTNRLPEPSEFHSNLRADNSLVRITVRRAGTGEVTERDPEYVMIMNIILRSCLRMLNLVLMRRDYYDPAAERNLPIVIQQGRGPQREELLRVWPGYQTTINNYHGGLLLNVHVLSKFLRGETVLDVMRRLYTTHGVDGFRVHLQTYLLGKVVMTRYNNKTYRIDDIDWEKNPLSTFLYRREDRQITYREYYNIRYPDNVVITDETQFMLVVRPSRRDRNRGDDQLIYLVPELCFMTGLDDEIRNNPQLMRTLAEATRQSPRTRVENLLRFMNERMAQTEAVQTELRSWGLNFATNLVEVNARTIPAQRINQADANYFVANADWSSNMQGKIFAAAPRELREWVIVYPRPLQNQATAFVRELINRGRESGFTIAPPDEFTVEGGGNAGYVRSIRDACSRNRSFIMVFVERQSGDTYAAIKKLTIEELGIPSQVITRRVADNNSPRFRSVCTKVMIQVCAKLGGEPWRVDFRQQDWMVCGYDAYHDARQMRAVGAFVASINNTFTRYISRVSRNDGNNDISAFFHTFMMAALSARYKNLRKDDRSDPRNFLPKKIFIYRDAVGAGDIETVRTVELAAIKRACRDAGMALRLQEPYTPGIAYILVSKRISTRFFVGHENPSPGFVVDNTVTLSNRFEFFLVSQRSLQGTVTPTSYNVIDDDSNTSADVHQRLAYALTHLYYNWAGTLRVPAPCQYAHKLAYLVGESMGGANPQPQLEQLPYYL